MGIAEFHLNFVGVEKVPAMKGTVRIPAGSRIFSEPRQVKTSITLSTVNSNDTSCPLDLG